MCQLIDILILKILPAHQHTAKQDGRIHRGDFRIPNSLAGIHVREVVKKTAMRRQLVPQKGKRLNHSQPGYGITYESAFFANADGGQAKAGGCNAGAETCIIRPDTASVLN